MTDSSKEGRLSGGCACGAVRYETSREWEFSFQCHCRKCQHATGTGHAPAFAVSAAETTLTGPLKYYSHTADNGARTYTGFCGECGSPIVSGTERFPERVYLLAASLDDPAVFKPQFAVFESEAQPWDPVPAALRG